MSLGVACPKKKEENDPKPTLTDTFTVVYPSLKYRPNENPDKVVGAKVDIFNTELDYFANQNPSKTLSTDSDGKVSITYDSRSSFWFRITKDTLNSFRAKYFKNDDYLKVSPLVSIKPNIFPRICQIMLSTTPVKLQLQVFRNGESLASARVRLFLSKDDLLNRANINYGRDRDTYLQDIRFKNYGSGLFAVLYLEDTTDPQGYVTLENLEPRKRYWISVDEKIPTSDSSIILQDNLDLLTSRQISIP